MRRILCIWIVFLSAAVAFGQDVSTLAGNGRKGFSGDGQAALEATMNNVYGVARGPDGAIYVCDMENHRVRRVTRDGIIETVAGTTSKGYSGDGGPAIDAKLDQPYEVAWDKEGNLYFVELGNHCVRRVDRATGKISTVAGNGKPGFSGDGGPSDQAQLNQPHSIAFDDQGDLFICDIANHRIRRVDMQTRQIFTWSGTGEKRTSEDGSPIATASLFGPRALVFGPDGLGYLALREGNAVLVLDPKQNRIKRIAGTGKSGFQGNGGPALQANLAGPKGISLGKNGVVYLADTESHTIRYIDLQTGTLDVLVGDGQRGDGPDGDRPQACRLARPHGVFVDHDGSVLIGDSENNRVRVWHPKR